MPIFQWFSRSISHQASALLVLIIFVVLLVFAFYFYNVQSNSLQQSSKQMARQLISSLNSANAKHLHYHDNVAASTNIKNQLINNQQQIEHGGLFKIDEIALLNTSGYTFAHSSPADFPLQKKYTGKLPVNGYKISDKEELLFYWQQGNDLEAVRIYANVTFRGRSVGTLILQLDLSQLMAQQQKLAKDFAAYGLLVLLIAIGIGLAFGRWVSYPAAIIEASLDLMGSGKLQLTELHKRKDEYNKLALALELADKNLHQSRTQVHLLLDSTAEAIYGLDAEGICTFVNRACLDMLGYKNSSELLGKNIHDLTHYRYADGSPYPEHECKIYRAFKKQQGTHVDNEVLWRKDGSQFAAEYWSHPIFKEGKCIGAVVTFLEITERLETQRALRRSQKMEAIGQLSGGIAHDFNNQLGVIIGYLDFLKAYVDNDVRSNDARPKKWIEISTSATLRCMDLTRQLLSFSRTQPNEKTVVDINAKLIELKTMLARSVTPQVDIQYSLSDKLWLTEVDPGEFQDAILNLVLNARDAMPGGGKLLIETSNKTLDTDHAALDPDIQAGDYVQLLLSDTGSGMDKATQERIFEPFYTTKPKGKGTGLGMAMVYGFAKRFAGSIQIYSEVDIGTTIRLYLPRTTASEINIVNEQPNEEPLPSGSETILIVDDEVDLLHLADKYLTERGYQTCLAENASQALEVLARQKDIDCLFSDVVMPGGINGYELAQRARQQQAGLKILLTSGFTSETIANNSLTQSPAHLLNKPYRKEELAQRIRAVLDEDLEA